MFVGRRGELDLLTKDLDRIRRTGEGRSVAIRGRRQVGKSRLVQELCDRVDLPYCFYTAVKGASSTEAAAVHQTQQTGPVPDRRQQPAPLPGHPA
jgi:uncharacterized protein